MGVDLRALQNLEAHAAIGVEGQERTSTWLAHVSNHTADTHGAVQFPAQCLNDFSIRLIRDAWHLSAELAVEELAHLIEFCTTEITLVQTAQVGEGLALKGNENAGDDLLPQSGCRLQAVGYHIIYILNEDDVGLQLRKVLDECSMASGTEE